MADTEALLALAEPLLTAKRRINSPLGNGERLVGFALPEEVAGLSDALFMLGALVDLAALASTKPDPGVDEIYEHAALVADYAVQRAERDWRDPAKQEAVKQVGAEIAEVIRAYKTDGPHVLCRPSKLPAGSIEAIREGLRQFMLKQSTTGDRSSYSDGFAQGLCYSIGRIDALLSAIEGGRR